jgi:hypothetical protein
LHAKRRGWRGRSIALVLVLSGCAPELDSPELQVRALLARAERAAEERDVGALKGLVAETYADDRGNDRQAVMGLLTYYFLRNKTIHLLTRVRFIEAEPERARAGVFVAMAGRPIEGVEGLARIRADLYRFDFVLERDDAGDWKVERAEWDQAGIDDFL